MAGGRPGEGFEGAADGPGARFEGAGSRLDRWYEEHPEVLASEVRALEAVDPRGRGLEVGVGTGVLAEALDVDLGLDPARGPLVRAADRGVGALQGVGEALPVAEGSLDRVLLLTTLCFLGDAGEALAEARRVLAPGGALVVADIPRDSAWGRRYQARAEAGEGLYAGIALRTVDEVEALLSEAGFRVEDRAGTLQAGPGEEGEVEPPTEAVEGCGYVCWRAVPAGSVR